MHYALLWAEQKGKTGLIVIWSPCPLWLVVCYCSVCWLSMLRSKVRMCYRQHSRTLQTSTGCNVKPLSKVWYNFLKRIHRLYSTPVLRLRFHHQNPLICYFQRMVSIRVCLKTLFVEDFILKLGLYVNWHHKSPKKKFSRIG